MKKGDWVIVTEDDSWYYYYKGAVGVVCKVGSHLLIRFKYGRFNKTSNYWNVSISVVRKLTALDRFLYGIEDETT